MFVITAGNLEVCIGGLAVGSRGKGAALEGVEVAAQMERSNSAVGRGQQQHRGSAFTALCGGWMFIAVFTKAGSLSVPKQPRECTAVTC